MAPGLLVWFNAQQCCHQDHCLYSVAKLGLTGNKAICCRGDRGQQVNENKCDSSPISSWCFNKRLAVVSSVRWGWMGILIQEDGKEC